MQEQALQTKIVCPAENQASPTGSGWWDSLGSSHLRTNRLSRRLVVHGGAWCVRPIRLVLRMPVAQGRRMNEKPRDTIRRSIASALACGWYPEDGTEALRARGGRQAVVCR